MSAAPELEDVAAMMLDLGRAARAAGSALSRATTDEKNAALAATAREIRSRTDTILAANEEDLQAARVSGLDAAKLERLSLDADRLEAIARAVEEIVALPDPVGAVLADWERPNGLKISRVRTPLGVIGVIYESRPNVTIDAAALCLKAGNAVILRSGSEAMNSATTLHACVQAGLAEAGLPEAAVQLVPTTDRAAVGAILEGLGGALDVVVPRGGKGLVERVQREARVPVIGHLEGLCHVYVDGAADMEKARALVVNAKMRRTGICGAAETLLVDSAVADAMVPTLTGALVDAGCAIRGDARAQDLDDRITPANEEDWRTEYLAPVIALKIVDGLDGALAHIRTYSTSHTECVITEDAVVAERFLNEIDSAIVMWNASTQFADGGEFGLGAEIGIATGRIHARGPVGLEQLTTFKYQVRGDGQVRP